MNNALQAYNVMASPTSDSTPQRSITFANIHLYQARQAQHGSLVDRGANGGLAGFDVRVLSKSSRKCISRMMGYKVISLDNKQLRDEKLSWDRHLNVSQLPFPSSQYCLEQHCTPYNIYIRFLLSFIYFYLTRCLHPYLILLSIQLGILFTYDHPNPPEYKTKYFVVNSIS